MYADIIELGQCLGRHAIETIGNELRIQGKPALNWVYEVARDCPAVDEVHLVAGNAVAIFNIDRDCEPARVFITNFLDGRITA